MTAESQNPQSRFTSRIAASSRRRPWLALLLAMASVGGVLVLIELLLRAFLPFSVFTIGHIHSSNAERYGWGYHPYEMIRTVDADNGRVYKGLSNNHGWRDRDRQVENTTGRFRILALGDSNTFGMTVHFDDIYTLKLEEMLLRDGYNAEVINMSYPGWGTDQEVEALRVEGLEYRPNLVILQFSHNDLWENSYIDYSEKKDLKPFYYTFNDEWGAVRHSNADWIVKRRSLEERIKRFISRSEILKRVYALYLQRRMGSSQGFVGIQRMLSEDDRPIPYTYTIDNLKLEHIVAVAGALSPGFSAFLRNNIGSCFDQGSFIRHIRSGGERENEDVILRVFEDRWFPRWAEEAFRPDYPDTNNKEWQLYFALVKEANRLAASIRADLALFSDEELGMYEWQRYWHIIHDDEESRRGFFGKTEAISRFAEKNGIGFVANTNKHVRPRNDMHPNAEGTKAMARNVYEYLLKHHRRDIEEQRGR